MKEAERLEFEAHKAHFGPISQELIDYVTNDVLLHSRYLFTTTAKGIQFAYCTHCRNKHLPRETLKHNEKSTCPRCNSICIVKKSHVSRKYLKDHAFVVYYQKSIIDPKVMTAVGFYVQRDYTGEFTDVETRFFPSSSYVFEMGNSTMYQSYWSYDRWYKCKGIKSEFPDYSNKAVPRHYSRESIANAIKGTPFQYSCWEQYDEQDMTKFFGLYSKYPCIEYLTKMGYKYFVYAKLFGTKTYDAIKWSGKTIEQVMKLNKRDLGEVRTVIPKISSWRDEEKALALKLFQVTSSYQNRPSLRELIKLAHEIAGFWEGLKPMLKFQTLQRCVAYVKYQRRKWDFESPLAVCLMWKDYIAECKALEFDLRHMEIVFPHNLRSAHESTSMQVKIQATELEEKKVAERAKELEKYRFSHNGYLVRPAYTAREIIQEGKDLRHCVGSYAKDHADGKTNILFIRKYGDLETPFYTMEVQGEKVIQVYGYKNLRAKADIAELVEAFKSERLAKKSRYRTSNRTGRQEAVV